MKFCGPGRFFTFYKKEHAGAAVLLILVIILAILPRFIFSGRPSVSLKFNEDSAAISQLIEADKAYYDSLKRARYKSRKYYSASAGELQKMGIDKIAAQKIAAQLKLNGFSNYSELSKISGIDSVRLKSILEKDRVRKDQTRSVYSAQNKLELNRADSLQLIQLSGVGPYFARKILLYRNKLGGFYSADQLFEIYGLDSTVVRSLMPIVFTDETAIIKLGISESNKTALEKHPYLNSRQLKALLSYKLQHGSITEQNFMQHPAIDPKHKNQLRHYLKFD